jgi:hypothetical protein
VAGTEYGSPCPAPATFSAVNLFPSPTATIVPVAEPLYLCDGHLGVPGGKTAQLKQTAVRSVANSIT